MKADTIVLDGEMGLDQNLDGEFDVSVAVGFYGLPFETGQFSVDTDTQWGDVVINFNYEHTEPPFFAGLIDATGTYDSTLNSLHSSIVWNFYTIFNKEVKYSSDTDGFVTLYYSAVRTSETRLTTSWNLSGNVYLRSQYITAERWKPGSVTSHFIPGRIYKWVAVWK